MGVSPAHWWGQLGKCLHLVFFPSEMGYKHPKYQVLG